MADPVISGNGVFSHVFIGAADVEQSSAFYDAALGALGVKNLGPFGNGWVLYGRDKPAFIIARPGNGEAPSSNGVTVGFAAATPAEVDAFHAAGLAAGGTDEGSRYASATPDPYGVANFQDHHDRRQPSRATRGSSATGLPAAPTNHQPPNGGGQSGRLRIPGAPACLPVVRTRPPSPPLPPPVPHRLAWHCHCLCR